MTHITPRQKRSVLPGFDSANCMDSSFRPLIAHSRARMRRQSYRNESNLVRQFIRSLGTSNTPWGTVKVSCEFEFRRGRTDILAVASTDGQVIAFEAKLEKWREALQQAYRNTCFAHRSYVVLPRHTAFRAQRHQKDFEERNVGLCYIVGCIVTVLVDTQHSEPLQPWLSNAAVSAVRGEDGRNGRTRTSSPPTLRKARPQIFKAG